jgi:uncharacterized membrane protein
MLRHVWPLVGKVLLPFLGVGVAIYHFVDGQSWTDSFLNASMLMGGMGPVGDMHSEIAKVLAGVYALAAGLVFVLIAGVMMQPVVHDTLRLFHLEKEGPGGLR